MLRLVQQPDPRMAENVLKREQVAVGVLIAVLDRVTPDRQAPFSGRGRDALGMVLIEIAIPSLASSGEGPSSEV